MRDVYQNKTSTQQKNLQILKSIIKRAVMDGLISPPDDPFNYFKIGSSKGSREKLPVETIRAMERLNLPQASTQSTSLVTSSSSRSTTTECASETSSPLGGSRSSTVGWTTS